MKRTVIPHAAMLIAALLPLSGTSLLSAQTSLYRAVPNASKLRLEGDSSMHKWAVETTLISGSMELPADFPLDASKPLPTALSALPKVQVGLPISEMRSDKDSATMDERMYKELKSAEHPRITYRLTEMKPGKAEGGKIGFDTKGELVVAGVTNVISMPVTFEKQPDNKLKVSGAVNMKISDFKIEPPSFRFIGVEAMKTKDEIKVSFEWVTALRSPQPAK
jgi:hypothetical protein